MADLKALFETVVSNTQIEVIHFNDSKEWSFHAREGFDKIVSREDFLDMFADENSALETTAPELSDAEIMAIVKSRGLENAILAESAAAAEAKKAESAAAAEAKKAESAAAAEAKKAESAEAKTTKNK